MTTATQTTGAPFSTEFGRAHLKSKGYPRIHSILDRMMYVYRRSFEFVANRRVRDGFHVHHQPNPRGKLCWLVTPNTVARDEDEMDLVTSDAQKAVEAAVQAVTLILEDVIA